MGHPRAGRRLGATGTIGRVVFEWLEGRKFLIQRRRLDPPEKAIDDSKWELDLRLVYRRASTPAA